MIIPSWPCILTYKHVFNTRKMRPRETRSDFRMSHNAMILVTVTESLNLAIRCVKLFINKGTKYSHKQNATEENVMYFMNSKETNKLISR